MRLLHLASTPSTNVEALRLAAAGERGPIWVVADEQTAGKGRSGRSWTSVPGNLYASLLIRPACPPQQLAELSLVAGVGALEAIRAAGGDRTPAGLRLKWPNDVLVGTAKLGGILVESSDAGGARAAVLGIGLNLAGFPDGLGREATALAHHGLTIAPRAMLESLDGHMDIWLRIWDDGRGFPAVRDAWMGHAGPKGEPLAVNTGAGRIEGRFAGLDAGGGLLLETAPGETRLFTFGDVTIGAAAPTAAPQAGNGRNLHG